MFFLYKELLTTVTMQFGKLGLSDVNKGLEVYTRNKTVKHRETIILVRNLHLETIVTLDYHS